MAIEITEGVVPQDIPPDLETFDGVVSGAESVGWFNPEYPHSTEEHPYGYFPDGRGGYDYSKPRKRRPHGKRESTGDISTSARADKTAKTAASMLARINTFVGLSLFAFGMETSRDALLSGNDTFEDMAYEALLTDPVLARKILSAGATSGKAQLAMAYVMLGGSVAPVAYSELKAKRAESNDAEYSASG